ncbi:transglutaminase family protein [Notoacmeibacter sp. MSK16QG-6]|uniref:transglutaminase family protein n=1 Tax=Notoacmeibacter sp. MSK16QG-6 TaxID=2957982 RepID=UPI00209FD48B|nr:transglutaminase family protein [Notoacmeibacter sp. MSK16QG-6]MCP1197815.1 transglutaminase family protein [Notoacmeibacter sp. MSK16QG-6]
MRIAIQHTSRYKYKTPPDFALQKARLTPQSNERQSVGQWQLNLNGARHQFDARDAFGNKCTLLKAEQGAELIEITAQGMIDTKETQGIMQKSPGRMPLFVFLQASALTEPDDRIADLADSVRRDDQVDMLHRLMDAIAEQLDYTSGATHVGTTAVEAFEQGQGVCQDFSHIFLAAARHLGIPARYASGYFVSGDDIGGEASHGWAETYLNGLGWVGFDPTNRKCPDERYVRIASGRDYNDACPISGVRVGAEGERLSVNLAVEQQ